MRWLCIAVLLGCNSSTSTSTDMARSTMMTCQPDGKMVNVGTKYGVQATLDTNVKVIPGCSGNSCIVDNDANAELLMLADVALTGTTGMLTISPCKLTVPPVGLKNQPAPIILSTPLTLLESAKPVQVGVTLASTDDCTTFSAQPILFTLGASMANPATDPLPTYSSNSVPKVTLCGGAANTSCENRTHSAPSDKGCVCDQENDGEPGASLDAKNIPSLDDVDKVYLDFRSSLTMAGQVYPVRSGESAARIYGTVNNLTFQQNVVGCHHTPPGSMAPYDCNDSEVSVAAGFNPAVTQSPNGPSVFQAVPVDASMTCEMLIAQSAQLFQ
jgi:hypothetical protein